MNHPSMTSRGRMIAALLAIAVALALPKRSPCDHPRQHCFPVVVGDQLCDRFETQPLAVYGLEFIFGTDLGLAYSHARECR